MAKPRRLVLWEIGPGTKAIRKVKTRNNIVDGLVGFHNLVFYFI